MAGTWKPPPGWAKLRQKVFALHGHACWRCGAYATTVDHVIPRALGGTDHLSNLLPACTRCNYSTGAALGNRLRAQRRAQAPARPWFTSRKW